MTPRTVDLRTSTPLSARRFGRIHSTPASNRGTVGLKPWFPSPLEVERSWRPGLTCDACFSFSHLAVIWQVKFFWPARIMRVMHYGGPCRGPFHQPKGPESGTKKRGRIPDFLPSQTSIRYACLPGGVVLFFRKQWCNLLWYGFLGNIQKHPSNLGKPSGDSGSFDSRIPRLSLSGGGYLAPSASPAKTALNRRTCDRGEKRQGI